MSSSKIDLVAKILAKAERAGTEVEAETYRAKATELMMQYSINEAELSGRGESTDTIGSLRVEVQGYGKQFATMLHGISLAFDCTTIRMSSGHGSGGPTVCVVYGYQSDLDMINVLFASLRMQATREAKMAHLDQPWIHGRAFTTSFLMGFSSKVGSRLRVMRQKATNEAAGTSTAVALVDRARAVQVAFKTAHPRTSKAAASRVSTHGAYYGGVAAGNRADLGQARVGGQRLSLGA